jgi:hypothetical protein
MVDRNGPNDRVSDLNCFWMARDPQFPDSLLASDTERQGRFSEYHCLRLYYVGYGANNNTTTRFRRYPGDCTRPLSPEYDLTDTLYMNRANVYRHVEIISCNGRQQYKMDGTLVFDIIDAEPFTSGWFGFRTVNNHMEIEHFRVLRILEKGE